MTSPLIMNGDSREVTVLRSTLDGNIHLIENIHAKGWHCAVYFMETGRDCWNTDNRFDAELDIDTFIF